MSFLQMRCLHCCGRFNRRWQGTKMGCYVIKMCCNTVLTDCTDDLQTMIILRCFNMCIVFAHGLVGQQY